MSDVKDVAVVDYKLLADMAKEVNNPSMVKLPVLKINNQAKSKYKLGTWVTGQKMKEGQIVEEGDEILQFIILKEYGRYTFFNKDDGNSRCFSKMLKSNEKTEGSKYKYQCGKQCPYRNPDLVSDKKCKFNKILFGYGVTREGNKIKCVTYLKGNAFKISQDYIDELKTFKTPEGKTIELPLFAHITMLSFKEEFNKEYQKNNYYPVFTKGKMITSKDILTKLFEEAKEIDEQVKVLNDSDYSYDYDDESEGGAAHAPTSVPTTMVQEKIAAFQEVSKAAEILEVDPNDLFGSGF